MTREPATETFRYRHHIRWGECASAGIVYAPNILG